jgi:hypothetical protein
LKLISRCFGLVNNILDTALKTEKNANSRNKERSSGQIFA